MANVKLYLDKRYKDKENRYPLCIQVAHSGKTRPIKLGIALQKEQWDDKRNVIKQIENSKRTTAHVTKMLARAQNFLSMKTLEIQSWDINQLKSHVEVEIKKNKSTETSAIARGRATTGQNSLLGNWGNLLIQRELDKGNVGKASWYKCAISAFLRFNSGNDLHVMDITESKLEEFIVWGHREIEGVKDKWKPNTLKNYLSAIRAILNKAIKEKKSFILPYHQPFKNIELPEEIKEVNSISKEEINKLRLLELPEGSPIWKARARFLFMFNAQGMNFTDVAKLRLSDLKGTTFTYTRAKTRNSKHKKRIAIAMTKEGRGIWDWFAKGKSQSDYVFDILHNTENSNYNLAKRNKARQSANPAITEKNRIKRHLKKQNKLLGELSEMIGSHKRITTYDARYGWTNSALDAGVSEDVIGKGLGHAHFGVTRRYFEERHKRSDLGEINELITG